MALKKIRLLDLFSGIGGFSLAAQAVWKEELEIAGFCEIDEFCHKILRKNFGDIPIHSDISTFDTSKFHSIDIITGGFPCQDISQAGREKLGIKGKRSGLWSEMFRVISEIRPRFVVAENVAAITFRGLDRVLSDLAEIRYDAEWQCISAAEVGAWHKRDRFWLVAYPDTDSFGHIYRQPEKQSTKRGESSFGNTTSICKDVSYPCGERLERRDSKVLEYNYATRPYKDVSDSSSIRSQRKKTDRELGGEVGFAKRSVNNRIQWGENSETESRLGGVANGLSYWMDEPKGIPRVTELNKHRKDRVKGLGNSIVPQVAYQIMKRIKNIDENQNTSTSSGGRNGGTRLYTH